MRIFVQLFESGLPLLGGRFRVFVRLLAPAVLTMVAMMAWRASTVAMRPRIPMRTCRRLTTWD